MSRKPITIQGSIVEPGQQAKIKMPVGHLPSGNQINIQAHVFHAAEPGPVMLALAGVHGDEINGVEILRQILKRGAFEKLERGSVIAIPVLNLYGFINFSRDVPDGKDVNRSFPGRLSGSLASRVARVLTRSILPLIDFGVDFHTGGRALYNYPQIRFSRSHAPSRSLAEAFGAPFLLAKPAIARSLRKVALDLKKPMLVFEGGESLRYDAYAIQEALEGLQRLMISKEMISGLSEPQSVRLFHKTSWVRSPKAGLFLWYKDAGQEVLKGEPVGEINDPYGQYSKKIYAPRDAFIVGHNNAPVVNQGDALFHLGYELEEIR